MKRYRIFTNDRGKQSGVAKYSALCEVDAKSPEAAVLMVNPAFGKPPLAPIKAVAWPAVDAADLAWLGKHV